MFGIALSKNRGHKMTSEIEFYSEGRRLANVVNAEKANNQTNKHKRGPQSET